MSAPRDDDRRRPDRRAGDRHPDEDTTAFVSRKVEAAVAQAVRSAAVVELTDEVRELVDAVTGYRNALERRLRRRTRMVSAALVVLLALLAVNAALVAFVYDAEEDLRQATAEAIAVECEKRKRLELGLIAFLEEASSSDPVRQAELLELAERTLSSRPCAELADVVRHR